MSAATVPSRRPRVYSLDGMAAKFEGTVDFFRELTAPHEDQVDFPDTVTGLAKLLPDDQAEAFILAHLHHLDIPEIAERIEADEGDVREMLDEAYAALRESRDVLELQATAGRRATSERAEARKKDAPKPPCAACGCPGGHSRDSQGRCWGCQVRAEERARAAKPAPPPDDEEWAPPCLECKTTAGAKKAPNRPPARTHGLCDRCYRRHLARERAGRLRAERGAPSPLPPRPCKVCKSTGGTIPKGYRRPPRMKGMCRSCYDRAKEGAEDRPAGPSPGEAAPRLDRGAKGGPIGRGRTRPERTKSLHARRASKHRRTATQGVQADPGGIIAAAPCVDCSTKGGYIPWDCRKPYRHLGRCKRCANRSAWESRTKAGAQDPPIRRRGGPALPCIRCQTLGGYVAPNARRPKRTKGMCKSCYESQRLRQKRDRIAAPGPGPADVGIRVAALAPAPPAPTRAPRAEPGSALDHVQQLIKAGRSSDAAWLLHTLANLIEGVRA